MANVGKTLITASILATLLAGSIGVHSGTTAWGFSTVDSLTDVDGSDWAYDALVVMVDKYQVLKGYPDHTFRGERTPSRYELAAALAAVMKRVYGDIARMGVEKANKQDLATLVRLQEEFQTELTALNAKVDAMDTRAALIEARNLEQDTRLDLLERTRIHGDLSIGELADIGGNGLGTGEDGFMDSFSGVARLRLGIAVPVIEPKDDSRRGEGEVVARLVGAIGRWIPLAGESGNAGNFAPISGYSRISGDASARNEGLVTDHFNIFSTGINERPNMYIESMYYRQAVKPGFPFLTDIPGLDLFPDNDNYRTTFEIYGGIIPWRNLFDLSPYRGDELNQFQNTALVNNPGILANTINGAIALAWHQGLGEHMGADFKLMGAQYDGGNAWDGATLTGELALKYDTGLLSDTFIKPGSVYLGGFKRAFWSSLPTALLIPIPFNNREGEPIVFSPSDRRDSLLGWYAGWNQEWWRGIGTSVSLAVNETDPYNALFTGLQNGTGANANFVALGGSLVGIQNALSAVVNIPLTAFNQDLTGRAYDSIGLGYTLINPMEINEGGPGGIDTTNEHVFEAYYNAHIAGNVFAVPSIQVILNRYGIGENDADVVLSFRTNLLF